MTRRFSFGEKGWWTQHSSVWPEKYRKPRTEILKLNTKHLKQKSENRNRTFQMRTAQLVGWTLDSLLIGYSLVQLEGEGSPLKISKDSGTIFRNILRSVGANRKHCTALHCSLKYQKQTNLDLWLKTFAFIGVKRIQALLQILNPQQQFHQIEISAFKSHITFHIS